MNNLKNFFLKELINAKQDPFPHIYMNNCINLDIIDELYNNFPSIDGPGWFGNIDMKLLMGNEQFWPEVGVNVFKILMSEEFCNELSNKFNTPKLYPTTVGGGYQVSGNSAGLPMHIDWQRFNNKYRWLNLHIYLNKNWNKFFGGELILYNNKKNTKTIINPEYGSLIIYQSSIDSLHGHPTRWAGPEPRKALSVFYFSDIPTEGYSEDKNVMGAVYEEDIEKFMNPDKYDTRGMLTENMITEETLKDIRLKNVYSKYKLI